MQPVITQATAIDPNSIFTFRNYPANFAVCSTTHTYENALITLQNQLATYKKHVPTVATQILLNIEQPLKNAATHLQNLCRATLQNWPNSQQLEVSKQGDNYVCTFTQHEYMSGYAYVYQDGNIREVELVEYAQGIAYYAQSNNRIECIVSDPDIIALSFESNEVTQIAILN